MNLIAATVVSVTEDMAVLALNGGSSLTVHQGHLTPGERVTVGIRPEHIAIAPEGSILGRVELVEHLGGEVIAYLSIGMDQPLTVKFTSEIPIKVGDNLRLAVRGQGPSVFDAQGAALSPAPVKDIAAALIP
jgi:ABC-type sugar transport system ATPase subunit